MEIIIEHGAVKSVDDDEPNKFRSLDGGAAEFTNAGRAAGETTNKHMRGSPTEQKSVHLLSTPEVTSGGHRPGERTRCFDIF